MTRYLRLVRQRRWAVFPEIEWLEPGELQADAMLDLQSSGNRLSVYRVDSDADVERVVVALAANRDHVANLDYAVFDDDELLEQGVAVTQLQGETPDDTANMLHHDVGELTVEKLALLARVVGSGEHRRVHRRDMQQKLNQALWSGHLVPERVRPSLMARIE